MAGTMGRPELKNAKAIRRGHARLNAGLNAVELMEQSWLAEMLEEHHVTMLDAEHIQYAEWKDAEAASFK